MSTIFIDVSNNPRLGNVFFSQRVSTCLAGKESKHGRYLEVSQPQVSASSEGRSLPQFSRICVVEANKTQYLKSSRTLFFSILNWVLPLIYQGEKKGKILKDKNIHGQIIQLLGLLKHLLEMGPKRIYLHLYYPNIFLRYLFLYL